MSRAYRSLLRHGQRRQLPTRAGFSRREMLRLGLAGAAAAVVGLPGCRTGSQAQRRGEPFADLPGARGRRVVVLGAGLAGLTCGVALLHAGADVTVLEAQPRPGGRVVTDRTLLAGYPVELGGEWVGTNHPTWQAMARRYDIEFVEAPEYDGEAPLVLEGRRLSTSEADRLYVEIDAVLAKLIEMARGIDSIRPFTAANAAELDAMSMADFIAQQQLSPAAARLMQAIEEADNGVPADRMSLLGYLSMVSGGGFRDYYEISETHRTKNGNEPLVQALARELGDRVMYRSPVSAVRREAGRVLVESAGNEELATVEADAAVLAIPAGVWEGITFQPALPPDLAPQMGHNTKLLLRLSRPVWREAGATPELVSDGQLVHLSWEARKVPQVSDGPTVMTLFSGAASADRLRGTEPSRRAAQAIAEVAGVYPGLSDATTADRFVDWPGNPFSRGSYSFPAPGQVTRQGPTLVNGLTDDGVAPMFFAGEHTSYGFAGYMEGALESGLRAARAVAASVRRS